MSKQYTFSNVFVWLLYGIILIEDFYVWYESGAWGEFAFTVVMGIAMIGYTLYLNNLIDKKGKKGVEKPKP